MRPKSFFLILFALSWIQLFPQVQNIRGKVVSQETNLPLDSVWVSASGEKNYTSLTDVSGKFLLENLPVGRYQLVFFQEGFEPFIIAAYEVQSGKEVYLEIFLQQSLVKLNEITIYAETDKDLPLNEFASVSARMLSVEETQRYAANFNDPARMAQSFAGISTTGDASNEIVVRGNSSRGILWRIEGIEIPNPNHFSNGDGGTGGGISMLSSQVLANFDFLTGAFPAEYGNASSGVFDLKFRKGNPHKRQFAFQFGVLGVQASAEGPFSKKKEATFLINYRYSTLKIFNAIGLPVVDNALVPEFQDISFHFSMPTKKAGTFSLFGIGGLSRAGNLAIKDSIQWTQPEDRFEDRSRQWLGVIGLSHVLYLKNKKTSIRSVLSGSVEDFRYIQDSLNQNYVPQQVSENIYGYYSARLHVSVTHNFNLQHTLKAGVYGDLLFYRLHREGHNSNPISEDGVTQLVRAYAQWKWRLSEDLYINGGAHFTRLFLNGSYAIEPRAGVTYRITKQHQISLGGGLHSRIEPISVYLSNVADTSGTVSKPNTELRLAKSAQAVVGYDWKFLKNFRLRTEVYYQYLFDVPIENRQGSTVSSLNLSPGFTPLKFWNRGEGQNYGLEITVEKFLANGYYFLITGSLFQSKYNMGDGVWRDTRYNGVGMANALGGYEFRYGNKKQHAILINTRLIWRGGNRFTPINLQASQQAGREVLFEEAAYTQALPDYFRWDASLLLKFNFKKWGFGISVEVQNIMNRKNVQQYYYDSVIQNIRTTYMFGIMPVFNFKFEL